MADSSGNSSASSSGDNRQIAEQDEVDSEEDGGDRRVERHGTNINRDRNVQESHKKRRDKIGDLVGDEGCHIDESKSSPANNAVDLMKKMLPEYIVNCFLSSGYDEPSVICGLDISDNPNNGIAKVENFINRKFVNDVNHNPTLLIPFEFPPGHRERICNFIEELKRSQKCCKKRTHSSELSTVAKKSRPHANEGGILTIQSVYKQVRHRLSEWSKDLDEEEAYLKEVKEDKHYSIQVSPQLSPGFFTVLIRCHNSKCRKSIKLQQKDSRISSSPFLVSNWTKHLRSCIRKNSLVGDVNQRKLEQCVASRISSKTTMTTESTLTNSSNDDNPTSSSAIAINVEDNNSVESYLESRDVQSTVVVETHSGPPQQTTQLENHSKFLSRSERNKRSLVKAASDPSQTHITDYLKIVDNIEKLVAENKRLSMLLSQFAITESREHNLNKTPSFTNILKQIFINAKRNLGKYSTHRRHPPILKKFSTVLFILAGPLAYELIQQNMPEALPCVRTVQSSIHSEYKTIHEGVFRFDEVRQHLDQYNAPLCISIAEDATRVIGRVDYDGETDRCVGFVLPSDENGLPIVDSFIAVSFTAIEKMFRENTVSRYAYVYMAQPLCSNVPPICLACLGTDNKFKAEDIMLRWKYIVEQCAQRDITVLSFGSDGDSRLMKSMKVSASFRTPQPEPLTAHIPPANLLHAPTIPPEWSEWYHIKPNGICYVQDTIHIAVKLKSRLLKPNIVLPMGKFFVDSSHLHALKLTFQKDKHGLRQRDIDHKDKQNFQAVINITSAGHLLSEIPQANATKCYVDLIKNVIDSYLDKSLDPIERLEKLWYVVFFLRYWRKWIVLSKGYTIGNNFVTSNAYNCIELNAHAMINYVIAIRDHIKENKCFVPWLLGSQCCETTFRTARSMSSIFSTVINFGMLGLLRRLHRLQIQLTVQAETQGEICFPRLLKHQQKVGKNAVNDSICLLKVSNEQIVSAVERGHTKAKEVFEQLGMAALFHRHSLWGSKIKILGINGGVESCVTPDNDIDDDDDDSDGEEDKDQECNKKEFLNDKSHDLLLAQEECNASDVQQIAQDLNTITKCDILDPNVKQHLEECHKSLFRRLPSTTIPMYERVEIPDKNVKRSTKFSPFLEIKAPNDQTVFIRKTTAIWLLQEGERVSTDRLFRVRNKQPYNSEISKCIITTSAVDLSSKKLDSSELKDSASPQKSSLDTASDIAAATTKDTIDLTDLLSECEDDVDDDIWIRIHGKTLRYVDKEAILKQWLWGTHLTAVQLLLKSRYPNINGLLDPSVFVHKDNQEISPGSVQILHVNGNHWITITTLTNFIDSHCDVVVYDSLYANVSQATKMLLARLIKIPRKELKIKIANTHKQAGSNDCGLFSAAYCTALVNGQDPSLFVYCQDSMRPHLVHCLEKKEMVCFPISRNRRIGTARYDEIAVYCVCRCPDDGSTMIQCDGKKCKDWFHQSCIDTSTLNKRKKWFCPQCSM